MTMLIDTRDHDDAQPVWEPNWAVWWRGTLAAALGVTAFLTAGAISLLAMLLAFYFACSTVERALPYHHGLGEYRQ
jgi:hypothetical protein